jgi:ATP-dependent helicase/nuclease subunit B
VRRLQTASDFFSHFRGQEILFVAPTRLAADDIVRSFTLRTGSSFGVHRFTPASLAIDIASERLALDGLSILGGVAVDALAARATERCRAQSALTWFGPVARTPGFFRALASTITELRMNDVDPEALAKSGLAGTDLSRLVREFEAALAETGIADLALIFRTAAAESSRYDGMPVLLLNIEPAYRLDRLFIARLIARSHAVCVIDNNGGDESIPNPNALERLRRHMFSVAAPAAGVFDSSVDFRSASDESREAVEVARAITALARDGRAFDQIAILLRNPEMYQPLVEDAMRRAHIPTFYTRGTRRPNPSGRAFLALLACASEGLSAARFGEYLSLGQVPQPDKPIAPPWVPAQGELFASLEAAPEKQSNVAAEEVRAPYAWERLLVDAAVIGGRERWERRLTGLDRELEKQILEVQSENEARLNQLSRRRARLNDLRQFALPLVERLAQLPSTATWGEWLDALQQLASVSLKQPEGVLTLLAELRPMAGIGSVTLDEVREVLTHRLTFLRAEPTERRYGKVFVATIEEAAGMSFETVFLPGLGEDIFPKRAFEDPLLLDECRTQVSTDLSIQDTRFADERRLFHIAAGAAEGRLFISYPRMNLAQARARGPSFYALEVIRAITGRISDLQELQRMASESSFSQAGWPAPRDPSVSIDDAEYDLALVNNVRRTPPQQAKGRGRYLVTANASLARSLRNRAGRWRRRWTEGDGIIDADTATLNVLANHRPSARPYSATALQQFASCPYRFLLSAIHRLQPREEMAALERMDPLTRGSLFHSIQFHLLTELRNRALLPITAANHAHVLGISDAVIDTVAGRYRDELAPAIEQIWEGEVEDLRWDVRGWLREMIQPDTDGWTPRWFELSFGLPPGRECDPASTADSVELAPGMRLRGSIDMIEERNDRLRITDHKTGRAPAIPPSLIGRGEVLQPILYAQVAESLLGKTAEAARLFFSTERGGYRAIDVPVNEESRAALETVIRTIDQSLTSGFLPAAPREGACKWCDYRIVCGPYEEMRVKKKPKDRLALLEELRKIP